MNNPAQSPGGVFMRSPGHVRGGIVSGADAFTHVYDICLDSSGNIIVGGRHYRHVGSTPEYARVVRLDSEGDLDTTFDSWDSFSMYNGYTHAVAVDSSDKVIEGTSTGYIARHDTDGSIDATFSTGTGFNGEVNNICIDSGGKILVGGTFSSYNGTAAHRIARLHTDGSIDATFSSSLPTGINKVVAMEIDSSGKIIISAYYVFPFYHYFIYKLNSDGTIVDYRAIQCYSIGIESSGKYLIGGDFEVAGGSSTKNLCRLNSDLTRDDTYETTQIPDNISPVSSICVDGSDNAIVAGNSALNFQVYKLSSLRAIQNTSSTFNSPVLVVCLDSSGKIIVGGNFNLYESTTFDHILRLNTDFTLDTTFRDGA